MYVALFWTIVLLLTPRKKSKPKYFLGIFMLAATLVYFSHAVFFTNNIALYLYIDSLYVAAMLSVFPLYYWYIRLLTVETTYQRNNLKLLIPATVFSIITAIVYCLMEDPLAYLMYYHFNMLGDNMSDNSMWKIQRVISNVVKFVFFVQILYVLKNGLTLIRKYEERINNFYSNTEGRSMNWVRWLIIIFALTGIMSSVINFIGRTYFSMNHELLFFPSFIFGTLIFMIGYLGNSQKHILFELDKEEKEFQDDVNSVNWRNQHVSNHIKDNRFWKDLKTNLIILFEEKLVYRRSDLKISQVSEMLNTNRTYISRLINEEFNCSFSYFVNKYRVNEAKEILENDASQELSLEQVADVVGFTSAGSLIRNFKQYLGITPGVFRMKRNNIEK